MTDQSTRPGLPAGSVVVIAGPDGSGKTSLARGLVERTGTDRVLWLHHRPRLLPSRDGGVDEPVTDPYGRSPYGSAKSTAKVVYYWLDYVLGWLLRVRRVRRGGGVVVLERGWWDLVADPRRYRLRGSEAAVSVLGRLLPRPTHTFVLTGPPHLLLERTGDNLTVDDLAAQLQGYQRAFASRRDVTYLDVSNPLPALADAVVAAVGHDGHSWAGLPRPANPRWLLPRSPNRVARGALRVHRPMTPHAWVVWHIARAGAAGGAARLLPAASPETVPDLAAVGPWIPAGGGVAVARSTHQGRHHALVVDRRGNPVAHVKVAADDAGRAALAAEGERLERFGPLVRSPVLAPSILHRGDGLLVTQAVAWRPSLRPAQLDPVVAQRLGEMFAAGVRGDGLGPAHGDVAPWNLLATAEGWALVDWEMATGTAPPFFDLVHWLIVSHAHLGRRSFAELVKALRGGGTFTPVAGAYATGAGLDARDMGRHVREYLDATDGRVDPRTGPGAREVPVRRRLRAAFAAEA